MIAPSQHRTLPWRGGSAARGAAAALVVLAVAVASTHESNWASGGKSPTTQVPGRGCGGAMGALCSNHHRAPPMQRMHSRANAHGWMRRLAPTLPPPRILLRRSSAGVWMLPHADTTTGALITRRSWEAQLPARASTPTARLARGCCCAAASCCCWWGLGKPSTTRSAHTPAGQGAKEDGGHASGERARRWFADAWSGGRATHP